MFQFLSKLLLPALVLLFLCILGVSVWFFKNSLDRQPQTEPFVKYLRHLDEIVIGVNPKSPPMAYLDTKRRPIGFDVDLGTQIGNELNLEAELEIFENGNSEKLLSALDEKKIDIIISSMQQTDELIHKYDISEPYLDQKFVIVFRKGEKALVSRINLAISNLKQKGVIDLLKKKWFENNK